MPKTKELEKIGFTLPQFDVSDYTYRYSNRFGEHAHIELENDQIVIKLKTKNLKMKRLQELMDSTMATLEENYEFWEEQGFFDGTKGMDPYDKNKQRTR